jgi:branched-subunit amino acid transport protein
MPAAKAIPSEARWPVLVALLALGLLNYALPRTLVLGPRWVVLAVLAALAVPTVLAHRSGRRPLTKALGFAMSGVVTLALVGSLALLIAGLPKKSETPAELAQSAACLWIANVLVFAIWYWRLDAGGPFARDGRGAHTEGDFFFPQMMEGCPGPRNKKWSPRFVDYLFIAFNNSTAFSPTDTPVLSRWAKVLTMLQAVISLLVVAVLASRAVGLI